MNVDLGKSNDGINTFNVVLESISELRIFYNHLTKFNEKIQLFVTDKVCIVNFYNISVLQLDSLSFTV